MASISHDRPLSAPRTQLTPAERGLLALPMLGAFVFGLLRLFLPKLPAHPGNELGFAGRQFRVENF